MKYIIVDLEATCWSKGQTPKRMEIIEIGAVMMDSSTAKPSSEFSKFVKPINEPILSDFCTNLTSIEQKDVDEAETFDKVLPNFLEWMGNDFPQVCCWGNYDMNQFRIDCERHEIEFPDIFLNHINIKREFARIYEARNCGMKGALAMLELPLDGTHHRGIDDAKNIAKIAQIILPKLETENSEKK